VRERNLALPIVNLDRRILVVRPHPGPEGAWPLHALAEIWELLSNGAWFAPRRKETAMATTVDALILDLLDWIGPKPRPYIEVIEAWRTSCPRLPVWEEANERGFVERGHEKDRGACVCVTADGMAFLNAHRRSRRA
jgi:hypothetical protein